LVFASLLLAIQLTAVNNALGKFEKSIARNSATADEEAALAAAEHANYTDIFQTVRFDGSSDPDAYLKPGKYFEYTYANFVDSEVLAYYDTRYESIKGKLEAMRLTYEANIHTWSQIRFVNGPTPENQSWRNDSIIISSPNGTIFFRNADYTGPSWGMEFAYRNGTSYQMLQAGSIDLEFSDCYVVEMKLAYSETYAPLAAFYSEVYQIVLLDKNLVPMLLCVQSENMVS
jgi:hypothetical protein